MYRRIRYGLMLNLREKTALAALAEADGGQSQASWLRRLIRTEALRRQLWAQSTVESREVRDARAQ